MVSLVAASMLLTGLATTIVIARKANSTASSAPATALSAAAAEQLAHDLTFADSFVDRQTTAVEFTVPDRDQDGNPEQIRYQWSGSGAPLLRTQNGGPLVQIVPSLQLFQLGYDLLPFTSGGGSASQSGEMLYASETAQQGLGDLDLTSSQNIVQYVTPTLPANTVSWRISRVRLRLKASNSTTGVALLQVRTTTGGGLPQPSNTVVAQTTLYEAALTTDYNWRDFTFINSPEVSPGTGLCIVLQQVKDTVPCTLQYRQSGASGAATGLLQSYFGGLLWMPVSGQSLLIRAYGTVTTVGNAPASNLSQVSQVNAKLQVGDATSTLESQIPILNRPEVP